MNTPEMEAFGVGIKMHRKLLSNMIGFSKVQSSLILIAVVIFLLVQGIGIWQELQFHKLRAEILGKEPAFKQYMDMWGCEEPVHALPKIIFEAIGIAILLGFLAYLIVYGSGAMLFQQLPSVIKYVIELTVAILLGAVFAMVSIWFSNSWVYDFWCGPLYGLLRSNFVYHWSMRLIFPMTSVALFLAMCLSNGVTKRSKSLLREQAHHE